MLVNSCQHSVDIDRIVTFASISSSVFISSVMDMCAAQNGLLCNLPVNKKFCTFSLVKAHVLWFCMLVFVCACIFTHDICVHTLPTTATHTHTHTMLIMFCFQQQMYYIAVLKQYQLQIGMLLGMYAFNIIILAKYSTCTSESMMYTLHCIFCKH